MRHSEFTRPALGAGFACLVGMSVGPTPMVSAVAGLFMKPLAAEFGLSRAGVSAILLMSPVGVGLLSPFGGRLLDRYGVRPVLLPVVMLFALANAAMMLVSQLWHYIALAACISACVAVHCYSSYTKVLAQWFVARRGLVTGLTIACGSGLGAAITPQLVQPLIAAHGWRMAYLGMAGAVTVWALPILFLLLRERGAQTPGESAPVHQGATPAQAMCTGIFWKLAAAMVCAPFAIVGTVGHLFPLLTERGVSGATAASCVSLIYVGGMIGQLSAGYVLDRVASPRIVLPFFGGALAGVMLLHVWRAPGAMMPGAVLLGLGQGAEMSILSYLVARYFGLAHYGAIYGRLFGFANLGIAGGLLGMGLLHDRTGGYQGIGPVFAAALCVALAAFASLPSYRFARRDPVIPAKA
ncbi:MFS transporter [Novosphingobium rosa]|uniref:MFS transporter n=1 Tax=Novosphingobium rosa TaxID=76978 RepID=UPI000A93A004|nr:MFS transporter [Novosphingobium rosa]